MPRRSRPAGTPHCPPEPPQSLENPARRKAAPEAHRGILNPRLFLTDYRTEPASTTYLKLGRGLKVALEGKKSTINLTEGHPPTLKSLV